MAFAVREQESVAPRVAGRRRRYDRSRGEGMPMVGMRQLGIYLMSIYLVFKGVEIFQLALTSARPQRGAAFLLGVLAVVASLAVAGGFVFFTEQFASSIANTP
jgi:hypothetical protein